MKYPKINISANYTDELGCSHICFLAKGISMEEYQCNGFCVLPYLSKKNPKSVFFPDLPYSKSFWKYIQNNPNKNLCDTFPKMAVNEVKSLLKVNSTNLKKLEEIKKEWLKIEKDFFTDLYKFLDFEKELSKVSEINILLTPYGTRGSFNPPRVGDKFKLFVTSRIDMGAGNIAMLILQNLFIIKTRLGGEINTNEYLRRMASTAFLFKHTYFKKYYKDFEDLLDTSYDYNEKELNDSTAFLTKLGFPLKEIVIDLIDRNFTKQELNVLKLLIKNKNKVVTFDEIAENIWQEQVDDKFSLESLAKIIQNLRNKIRNQGIKKEVIFTKRGKGYLISS